MKRARVWKTLIYLAAIPTILIGIAVIWNMVFGQRTEEYAYLDSVEQDLVAAEKSAEISVAQEDMTLIEDSSDTTHEALAMSFEQAVDDVTKSYVNQGYSIAWGGFLDFHQKVWAVIFSSTDEAALCICTDKETNMVDVSKITISKSELEELLRSENKLVSAE